MDGSECEDNLFISTQHIIIIISDKYLYKNYDNSVFYLLL